MQKFDFLRTNLLRLEGIHGYSLKDSPHFS